MKHLKQYGILVRQEQLDRISKDTTTLNAYIVCDNLEIGTLRVHMKPRREIVIQNYIYSKNDLVGELIINDLWNDDGIWVHSIEGENKSVISYMIKKLYSFANYYDIKKIGLSKRTYTYLYNILPEEMASYILEKNIYIKNLKKVVESEEKVVRLSNNNATTNHAINFE